MSCVIFGAKMSRDRLYLNFKWHLANFATKKNVRLTYDYFRLPALTFVPLCQNFYRIRSRLILQKQRHPLTRSTRSMSERLRFLRSLNLICQNFWRCTASPARSSREAQKTDRLQTTMNHLYSTLSKNIISHNCRMCIIVINR